jgi:uncharacterized membrane protein YfcA
MYTAAIARGIPFILAAIAGQYFGMKSIRVLSQASFNRLTFLTILSSGVYSLASSLVT